MKYTIEINDTQQRIIDVLEAAAKGYASYSFCQNEDRTGISLSLAHIKIPGCQDTNIEFYFTSNEIWLTSYQNANDSRICDEFRAKESTLIAVAQALDPNVKIAIKKGGFQEETTLERL